MYGRLFIVFALLCLCFYLYGVLFTLQTLEPNRCKMTYMFEFPQYVKINFEGNENFPKYNLFAYSEGHLTENARNMVFNGAPVLFIPGNSGSHKQVRSLASVALRKGVDRNMWPHLDFFTVDLNEEYSGIYGGLLHEQQQFLEKSISAILKLYKNQPNRPKKLVLIGHSIGGKLAQSLLTLQNTSSQINTVISLASPMDKPVLALDSEMYFYYQNVHKFWMENRHHIVIPNNQTNNCANKNDEFKGNSKKLDDKLLITIGGGSRDLLVSSGLTDSKFSNVHASTESIPDVWVSTDHLCVLWCLQFMLVVNRFLYSIVASPKSRSLVYKGQPFIDDISVRLEKAKYYFESKYSNRKRSEVTFENPVSYDWIEDSRRVFNVIFTEGINKTRVQMIRLSDNINYKRLKVEVVNLETDDWVFGCSAVEATEFSRFCSKATSLTYQTIKVPSVHYEKVGRVTFTIDLHSLKEKNPTWTHLLLKFDPTKEPFKVNVDIHNPADRILRVPMPKWYSFSTVEVLPETLYSALSYQLSIFGLEETHQALEVYVKPKKCASEKHDSLAKLCVPWTKGFSRFHSFTEDNFKNPMYVYTEKKTPPHYNSTNNSIIVDLLLDSNCRYTISVKNSFGKTLSRIHTEFFIWLPAHLVCIILLALKNQISLTPKGEDFKCGSYRKALANCTPFFVITASRVFVKFILFLKFLPPPEEYDTSLLVSAIIHGSAMAALLLSTAGFWIAVTFCGNIAHKMLMKLIKFKIPTISDVLMSVFEKFPISATVLLVAIGISSCGAVMLLLASIFYFFFISKKYEDYLEEFVYKTAALIAKKLFGDKKVRKSEDKTKKRKRRDPNYQKNALTRSILDSLTKEEREADEELNKMLEEQMKKQEEEKLEAEKKDEIARKEYDSITEGLSDINFHIPLFFLLSISTLLNMPASITWAKNYDFSLTLSPDPTLLPSLVIVVCLGIIWQIAPRNIEHYNILGSIFYIAAVICVLYCQNSMTIFRLNYLIAAVYLLIVIHQIFGRKPVINFMEYEPSFLSVNSLTEIEENNESENDLTDIDGTNSEKGSPKKEAVNNQKDKPKKRNKKGNLN